MLDPSLLQFGKIDAKNEILTRDLNSKRFFLDSFTKPDSSEFSEVLNGSKYLIYGTKGTGKTALLRYIRDIFDENKDCTKFILFSENISEAEKNRILGTDNLVVEEKPDVGNDIDVKDMWSVFVYRKIIDLISENPSYLNSRSILKELKSLFDDIYKNNAFSTLSKIRRNFKNGKIRLSSKIRDMFNLEATADVSDINDATILAVDYSELNVLIERKLSSIEISKDVKYCLFVDELNLSMMSKKQHKRDSILIRDLIISCSRLNSFFSEKSIPIYIYVAIRTEVIASKNVSQNEINKQLADSGLKMDWFATKKREEPPIFNLIENKILASERLNAVRETPRRNIWTVYFSRNIMGMSPKKFIEDVTWCSPRDVVNLLGRAVKHCKDNSPLGDDVFRKSMSEYSTAVWQERFEELNAEYSATEIGSIKRILTNFHKHFKLAVVEGHAKSLAERDQNIMQLISTKGMKKVCEDLYYTGILGQSFSVSSPSESGSREKTFEGRWFHKSQSDFDQNSWIIVHKGLWPELRIAKFKYMD